MGVSLTSKLDRIVEEKKGSIPSIERRAGLSLAEFDATYREQRPVILTDACNDWPARKKWTFDFFFAITTRTSPSLRTSIPLLPTTRRSAY